MPDSPEARQFLVVVDDTTECRKALRFAWRRAQRTGAGVTLLRVIDPVDFQHWLSVEERMREEAREEAEELLQKLAVEVQQQSTILPELVVREGAVRDAVVKLIDDIRMRNRRADFERSAPCPDAATPKAAPVAASGAP